MSRCLVSFPGQSPGGYQVLPPHFIVLPSFVPSYQTKDMNKSKEKRDSKDLRLGDKLGPRLIRDNVTEGRDLALELARSFAGPLEDSRLVLGSGRHVVSLLVLREAVVVVAADSDA